MSKWRQGKAADEGEPGLDAVRREFGEPMVQRFRNWPKLAETYALAQGAEPARDVEQARKDLRRATAEKEFALDQARKIASWMPPDRWDIVPSVAQLREQWDLGDPLGPAQVRTEAELRAIFGGR